MRRLATSKTPPRLGAAPRAARVMFGPAEFATRDVGAVALLVERDVAGDAARGERERAAVDDERRVGAGGRERALRRGRADGERVADVAARVVREGADDDLLADVLRRHVERKVEAQVGERPVREDA